jgi:hypothetical protein
MEDSMVADAELWFLLAAAIAFIACGCHYTRRPAPKGAEARMERELDRAA